MPPQAIVPWFKTGLAALLVALLGSCLVLGAAPAGSAKSSEPVPAPVSASAVADRGGVPAGFVRHRNSRFWTWFGPRSWISSDSAYGITQSSADGALVRDLGFSSTTCSAGATPAQAAANHFAGRRSQLPVTFTRVGRVRPLGGAFFVQVSQFRVRSQGTRFRGELVQHYDGQPIGGFCFEQNESRTAPARGFDQSIRVLRAVARYSFYCGPGAEEPGPEPPPRTC